MNYEVSVHRPYYLPTYLLTYLPTYISNYLHTYLFTYLPAYLAVCIPTYLTYLLTYISTYRLTYLPDCLPIDLTKNQPTFPPNHPTTIIYEADRIRVFSLFCLNLETKLFLLIWGEIYVLSEFYCTFNTLTVNYIRIVGWIRLVLRSLTHLYWYFFKMAPSEKR